MGQINKENQNVQLQSHADRDSQWHESAARLGRVGLFHLPPIYPPPSHTYPSDPSSRLPPPSLFQEPKSESLTLSPSEGGKEDFLHETITSVPSSLSLSVNVCLSTRSKSSPHSCKGGLKMKFERAGEASIALSYMDGRSVVVTTIMRDPLLSPDQCFHDWEG